uniref:Uncharacterized protein n=1 Tax=Anguilla anguilla TaxID=7936 RepID=A0A0E9XQ75_ANGAN
MASIIASCLFLALSADTSQSITIVPVKH